MRRDVATGLRGYEKRRGPTPTAPQGTPRQSGSGPSGQALRGALSKMGLHALSPGVGWTKMRALLDGKARGSLPALQAQGRVALLPMLLGGQNQGLALPV